MSGQAAHIGLATLADVDALASLETRLFFTDRCSRRIFWPVIRRQAVTVLRNDEACAILGYAILLARRNSGKMRLYSFGIVEEARRQGLAKILLYHLEEMARAAGKHTLTLEVGDGNLAALSFYRRHGFTQYGFRLHYYEDGGHAILMKKPLAEVPEP